MTANEYTLRDPQGFEVDLFPFGNLNIEGRALGREMQLILQKSELLRLRVIGILKERNEEIQRKFVGILIDEGIPGLPDYYSAIIQAMLTGTEEYRQ